MTVATILLHPELGIVQLVGGSSTGKSYTLYRVANHALEIYQKFVLWIDGDRRFDPRRIQPDRNEKIIVVRPDSLEDLIDFIIQQDKKRYSLWIIDSIAGIVRRQQAGVEFSALSPAQLDRLLLRLGNLLRFSYRSKATLVLIANQITTAVVTPVDDHHTSDHYCNDLTFDPQGAVVVPHTGECQLRHIPLWKHNLTYVKNALPFSWTTCIDTEIRFTESAEAHIIRSPYISEGTVFKLDGVPPTIQEPPDI